MPETITLTSTDLLRPASSRQRRGPIEPVSVTVPSPTKARVPTTEGYLNKKQHLPGGHLAQLQPIQAEGLGTKLRHTPPKVSSQEPCHPALQQPIKEKKLVDPLPTSPTIHAHTRALSPPDKMMADRPMSRRRVVPPVQPVATPRPGGDTAVVLESEAALLKRPPPPANPNTLILSPVGTAPRGSVSKPS